MYIWKFCAGRSLVDSVWLEGKINSCCFLPACVLTLSFFMFAETVTNDIDIWNRFSVQCLGNLLAQQGGKRERFHLPPLKITVMLMPFSDLGKLEMVVVLVQEQQSHRTKGNFLIWELILLFRWIHLHAYFCCSKWSCSLFPDS